MLVYEILSFPFVYQQIGSEFIECVRLRNTLLLMKMPIPSKNYSSLKTLRHPLNAIAVYICEYLWMLWKFERVCI
jgi:hypothetical protein